MNSIYCAYAAPLVLGRDLVYVYYRHAAPLVLGWRYIDVDHTGGELLVGIALTDFT